LNNPSGSNCAGGYGINIPNSILVRAERTSNEYATQIRSCIERGLARGTH